MATKTQQAAAQTPPAVGDPHAVYPTHYDVTLRPEGACRATASVNINGCFAVRGVKVMESSRGLFVSMPSYKAGNGEYKDICFPCTKEARMEFDNAVISAYRQGYEPVPPVRARPYWPPAGTGNGPVTCENTNHNLFSKL